MKMYTVLIPTESGKIVKHNTLADNKIEACRVSWLEKENYNIPELMHEKATNFAEWLAKEKK